MAVRKKIGENQYRQLTDKEIKAEIMRYWGLDPKNREDQLTYKRRYDVYALRTKNYNKQQNLETPLRANEILLKTLRRQSMDIPLSAEQQNILSTSAQNSRVYAQRVERGDRSIQDQGILNLENTFNEFLTKNTRGYEERYREFRTKEVLIAYVIDNDGQVIASYNLTEGETIPDYYIEYNVETATERVLRTDQTIQEVKSFLESLADELHTWQKTQLKSNRAILTRAERKRIGS